ncbi:YfhO family protein [Nitrospinae bacterium AH_259_B05_G02_I21]|nr:YfhO family protein [Nitrospinae bacterium AH_259_B05_G02_I21]
MCLYVGLVPLAFAALALVRRRHPSVVALAAMGAASLVLALDGAIPGLGELLAALPGFRAFRGYSKFIAIAGLALAVLAGWGLEAWMAGRSEREEAGRPRARRLGGGLLLVAGAAALGLWLWTTVPANTWESIIRWAHVEGETRFSLPASPLDRTVLEETYTVARLGVVRALAVVAAFGGLLYLSGLQTIKTRWVGLLVVLLAAADLAAFGMPFGGVKTPLEHLTVEPRVAAYLSQRVGPNRIMTIADSLPNRPLAQGFAFFGGSDTLVLDHFVAYFNKAHGFPIDRAELDLMPIALKRLADIYAVAYVLGPTGKRLVHRKLQRVFVGRRQAVYRSLEALPRAVISGRVEVLDGRGAILEKLAASGYDPREALYVTPGALAPGKVPSESKKPGTGGTAEIIVDAPNQVVVEAALETAGYLYLADPAYPGWRVEVDGRPGRWFIANVCCRAVALPAGRHRVVFTFRPRGFAPLAMLSAAAWLGSLIGAAVLRRRPVPPL